MAKAIPVILLLIITFGLIRNMINFSDGRTSNGVVVFVMGFQVLIILAIIRYMYIQNKKEVATK